jgi:predicted MFS family arabinose efflux permease
VVLGPPIGGVLITHFGWQSIFLLVMAISLVTFVMAFLVVPESADPKHRDFDAVAQILGAVSLASFAFAAIECRANPTAALLSAGLAAVTLRLFVSIEQGKGARALVPIDMFSNRTFCGALVAAGGMTYGMYGMLFILPQTWLGLGQVDAATAGLLLLPMAVLLLVVAPRSGALAQRFGARRVTGGGVMIIGCGLLAIAAGARGTALWPTEIGLALTGLGMGFSAGPMAGLAVGAVSAERSGTASALNNVARMIGATTGVAVLGVIYAHVGAGVEGLRTALIVGGAFQLCAGATAWALIQPSRTAS